VQWIVWRPRSGKKFEKGRQRGVSTYKDDQRGSTIDLEDYGGYRLKNREALEDIEGKKESKKKLTKLSDKRGGRWMLPVNSRGILQIL